METNITEPSGTAQSQMDPIPQVQEHTIDDSIEIPDDETEFLGADAIASNISKGINVGKRKRVRTSLAWKLFQDLPVGADGVQRAKCKQCGIIYVSSSSGGTGNMKNHIKKCPRNQATDIGQLIMSQTKEALSMRYPKFDPEQFRDLVVEAIIKHNLPFNFVEYEGIRALFRYISEDIKLPSRNTAKSCVLKLFKREKDKILDLLKLAPGRISLTSDLWTSVATDGYLTQTTHFIDHEWKLQKRILNFCLMPPPHTGFALSEKIMTLLREWKIENKLYSITLDNASSNIKFVDTLKNQLNERSALVMEGKFFHVRCCAHILNLIVQDGLEEIDKSVDKIRESCKYLKGSSARKYKFYDCVEQVNIKSKRGLRQDVPTRWNSTYLMLDSALFYRRAFIHLKLSDSNYQHCPSQEEWERVEKISKFLGLFYSVTCLFSGTLYPTSNFFFPKVFTIQLRIKSAMDGLDLFLQKMARKMNEKFKKYWSKYSLILAVAVILDPRYKYEFVVFAYKMLHGENSDELDCVHKVLHSLFDSYLTSMSYHSLSHDLGVETGPSRAYGDHVELEDDSLMEDFDNTRKDDGSDGKSELQNYLDEKRLDRKLELDILGWWKGEQKRYPILANMARDVLSIPISTVASESAFSIGGRVLDQYRSSLLPDTVQALLCTRDWLFGKKATDSPDLDELTEDIFNLDISRNCPESIHAKSGQSSTNTISVDD